MGLAGGIAWLLGRTKRSTTGEGGLVDGSLLGTAMWAMQMGIVGAAVAGLDEMPKGNRTQVPNPLVNSYQTSDGRWIALCMLQPDVYWAAFCMAIGRKDLIDDARFDTALVRAEHGGECVAELDTMPTHQVVGGVEAALGDPAGTMGCRESRLRHARRSASTGQRLSCRRSDYGDGRELPLIANPVQFDREPPELEPAPEFGADTDEILLSLGWDWDAIIEAKASGAVL